MKTSALRHGLGKIRHGLGKIRDDSMDDAVAAKTWLLSLKQSHGLKTTLEQQTLSGLQVVKAENGRIICSFVVPKHLSDADGNWHPGAIATVIDDICGAAAAAGTGLLKASAGLDISYLSPAKIDEEVEIEARVIGHKGKLSSVIVDVRKKESGQLVAVAKQWMSGATPIRSRL